MVLLNEVEKAVAAVIKEHAESLDPPATARFAGGWVRDKLLGIESCDIDVTLDNVSGYAFAVGLSARYAKLANMDGEDEEAKGFSVHRILANPDKSKHLETAVVAIHGISVDFAHLRSEKYADTRIPTIEPGTPYEDATRRDLTINALFYNLHTGEVEDYTGRGLADIENRLIRTPLDPEITLYEDPLRILRIFRINAKLDFNIADSIYQSLKSARIYAALLKKVSPERISAELFKMLDYKNGYTGLVNIVKTGYVIPIFKPPVNIEIDVEKSIGLCDQIAKIMRILSEMSTALPGHPTGPSSRCSAEAPASFSTTLHTTESIITARVDIPILWLYTVLHNFAGIKLPVGKKQLFVNELIIKDSLKCSRAKINSIKNIEASIEYLRESDLSDIIESVLFCREHLFESLLICAVITSDEQYIRFIQRILLSGLYDCYLTQPLVTGNDLKDACTSYADLKSILHRCLAYQIRHPQAGKNEILLHAGIKPE